MILGAGTLLTGRQVLRPGRITVTGGRVTAVDATAVPDRDLGDDALLVPGFVDMHVHGGGGGSYAGRSVESAAAAAAFHRAHGTTGGLASLVSATPADLLDQVRMLRELVADGLIGGVHLEGPWLSPRRRGAHDPRLLADPDRRLFDQLVAAGEGVVRMVTIAPELPGGLELIRQAVAAGVVAAVGHTDASLTVTREALDAGATVATHLFNAMPPIGHRAPGPVVALMSDPRVTVELIADGVHTDPAMLAFVQAGVGVGRLALVTDAMAAAGRPDGDYPLGPLTAHVRGGVARLADGSIAGGTATMADLFRAAAGPAPTLDSLAAAVAATSTTPARTLGLTDRGFLEPGARADIVVLDAGLAVREVL